MQMALVIPVLIVSALQFPPFSAVSNADEKRAGEQPRQPITEVAAAAELTMTATILLPDGSPATRAVVRSFNNIDTSMREVTADSAGRFELRDVFVNSMQLHILSADGGSQKVIHVPGAAVRSRLTKPVTITLEPAATHRVLVTDSGRPVKGAHVGVSGSAFQSSAMTMADGTAVVRYPGRESINSVVAWHAKLGVNGIRSTPEGSITQLQLLAPRQHVIRLLDSDGLPITGQTISANVRMDETGWILVQDIVASQQATDQKGEVRFDWFPATGAAGVDVELFDPGWKEDETDQKQISEGLTTMRLRKEYPVSGRMAVPDGVDAEGILVTGFGLGVGFNGDLAYARTRKDGTFTMNVPAGHGYIIGISDLQWSSDLWTGVILPVDDGRQQDIALKAYPATPVEFHVTRGSSHEPVANAWLYVSRNGDVRFTDETGKSRHGTSGIRGWLRTDENGRAYTAVGRGNVDLRISSGTWSERTSITVESAEPVRVEFHRKWLGNRTVVARPVVDGEPFTPSKRAVAMAWTGRSPELHPSTFTDTGEFEVEFDEDEMTLLLLDRNNGVSGLVEVGKDDESVDLKMLANATFSGRLLDKHDDSPLADRTVQLLTKSAFLEVVAKQQTDGHGRFHFTDVVAGVPLRLSIQREPGKPDYFLFGGDRLFKPGESRTNDVAKANLMDGNTTADRRNPVKRTIAERMERSFSNAAAMRMRAIAILEGDTTKRVKTVSGRLRNIDENEAVAGYLPVTVTAEKLPEQTEMLAELQWPVPKKTEVVLIYSADGKAATDVLRLNCADVEAAFKRGTKFVQQHQPEKHDARKLLETALHEAEASQRKVWLIAGGCRCGPCFQLARWVEQQSDVLKKDLVIVKVTGGLDPHTDDLRLEIGGEGHGVPFHALLSSDNEVLMTSEGSLGNIGMPGSVEGLRHFRSMLESARRNMTADEIDGLIDSLSED